MPLKFLNYVFLERKLHLHLAIEDRLLSRALVLRQVASLLVYTLLPRLFSDAEGGLDWNCLEEIVRSVQDVDLSSSVLVVTPALVIEILFRRWDLDGRSG